MSYRHETVTCTNRVGGKNCFFRTHHYTVFNKSQNEKFEELNLIVRLFGLESDLMGDFLSIKQIKAMNNLNSFGKEEKSNKHKEITEKTEVSSFHIDCIKLISVQRFQFRVSCFIGRFSLFKLKYQVEFYF